MSRTNFTREAHVLASIFTKASALAIAKLKDSDGDESDEKLINMLSERIASNPAMLAMAIEAVIMHEGPSEDEINNSLGYLLANVSVPF